MIPDLRPRSVSDIIRWKPVVSGECSDGLVAHAAVVLRGSGPLIRDGLGPLQQPQCQAQVTIHPGTNGHGSAGIVEALTPIPVEDLGIRFVAIAGQAGRHTVFSHTQPAQRSRMDVVNRFGRVAAINALITGVCM